MAALLVAMSVMAIVLSVAAPIWQTAAQREREAELVFRGEQYAHAVALFQRKYAGGFPPNLDILLKERFLRKRYKDPMAPDGEFQLLYAGQPLQGGQQAGQPLQRGQAGQVGQGGQLGQGQPGRGQQGQGQLGQTGNGGRAGGRGQTGRVGGGPVSGVQSGIMGVASKSKAESLRQYNGRGRYNEWTFVATTQASTQAGTGAQLPGRRGGFPGRRGGRPGDPNARPGLGLPRPVGPARGLPAPGYPQPGAGGISPGLQRPGQGQRGQSAP